MHFSESRNGIYLNPLRGGALEPYADTTRPQLKSLRVERGSRTLSATPSSGTFDLVVEAYDTTPIPIAAPWHDKPVTPAVLQWRPKGSRVWRTAVDVRWTIPDDEPLQPAVRGLDTPEQPVGMPRTVPLLPRPRSRRAGIRAHPLHRGPGDRHARQLDDAGLRAPTRWAERLTDVQAALRVVEDAVCRLEALLRQREQLVDSATDAAVGLADVAVLLARHDPAAVGGECCRSQRRFRPLQELLELAGGCRPEACRPRPGRDDPAGVGTELRVRDCSAMDAEQIEKRPVAASKTIESRSRLPVTSRDPSGLKATESTSPLCCRRTCVPDGPVRTTVRPTARAVIRPSGLLATSVGDAGPFIATGRSSGRSSTSQTRAVPSVEAVTRLRPSAENRAVTIVSSCPWRS